MKNLILQHWNVSPLPDWASICADSIIAYADMCEADYRLLDPDTNYLNIKMKNEKGFYSFQKIAILDEKYDSYDNVLMLDMDMAATKHFRNIFDYPGIGRLHLKAMTYPEKSKNGRDWPKFYIKGEPMFFGNCVKLTRAQRMACRNHLDVLDVLGAYSKEGVPPNDEVMIHYLLYKSLALQLGDKPYSAFEIPHNIFCDMPEEAYPDATLIHYCGPRKSQIIPNKDRFLQ